MAKKEKCECFHCGAKVVKHTFKTKGKTFIMVEKNCVCDVIHKKNAGDNKK